MTARHAGDVCGVADLDSMLFEASDQGSVIAATQRRMGFAGGPEILLYAQMDLH